LQFKLKNNDNRHRDKGVLPVTARVKGDKRASGRLPPHQIQSVRGAGLSAPIPRRPIAGPQWAACGISAAIPDAQGAVFNFF